MNIHNINFVSTDFLNNPYPTYKLMRDYPIHYRDDWGFWVVTRYADVNTLLRDKRLGRAILHVMSREELGWELIPEQHAPFYEMDSHSLMELEPPDHTRLKSLVHKAFTPRTVNNLAEHIRQIASQLLDRQDRTIDLLEEFAVPLSVTVIAELLGVPSADRHKLRPWSHDIVQMYEIGNKTNDTIAMQAVRAVEAFSDYLRHLITQKRDNPRDDLLSQLVAVEDEGTKLTEAELISTCILILNAGHEATVNVVGNGMYALINHPTQLQLLYENPHYIKSAIEEMMRYDTPLPMFRRWVLEDMDFGGVHFRCGQEVALFFGSANHDEREFEHPEQFDITRQHNSHLSFGAGIHYCLGAPLARLELNIALESILSTLHNIKLLSPVNYQPTFVFRGLTSLPISWTGQ